MTFRKFYFFNKYYLINLNFNRFLFKLKLNITNKMFLKYLNKKKTLTKILNLNISFINLIKYLIKLPFFF